MRRPPVVNGVRIDPLDRSSFVARIEELLDASGSSVVHFVPADPTVVARRDPEFRGVLNRGALNVADGKGWTHLCIPRGIPRRIGLPGASLRRSGRQASAQSQTCFRTPCGCRSALFARPSQLARSIVRALAAQGRSTRPNHAGSPEPRASSRGSAVSARPASTASTIERRRLQQRRNPGRPPRYRLADSSG